MDTLLYGAGLVVMGNTAECLVLDHQIRPVAAMAYRSARTARTARIRSRSSPRCAIASHVKAPCL
jgi:hypothetical protein